MAGKLRIYIGGLGSGVHEDDLKSRFTSPQLGTVESVEMIRSKDRSFAYLDFVPASDKGLAKLFSTYNGCLWKGGKLRLEKAREHYLTRLQHEWEEEAELKTKSSFQIVDADENVHTFQKPIKHQDIEKMQLKMFFPKLWKIKPLPLKGTGKHKYSFQRVEIPPMPTHFCDCEEHSGPLLAQKNDINNHARGNCEPDDHETGECAVNEDELNMMKTVLDKLLEKGNCSERVSCRDEFTEEMNRDITSVEKHQVEDDEEDVISNDDDDILINVASRASKRVDVFKDWSWKTTAVNQDYMSKEPESFSEPHELRGNKNGKLLAEKKRKLPIEHIHADNIRPAERQPVKRVRPCSGNDPVATCTQPIHTESGSKESGHGVSGLRKSAWRDLVKEKQSSTFHISDILLDGHSEAEIKPGSDVAPSSVGKNDRDDQLSNDDELENAIDDGDDQLSYDDELENAIDDGDDQVSNDDELENAIDDEDDQLSNDDELENAIDDGDDQISNDDELENVIDDGDDQLSNDGELENAVDDGDDQLSNGDELENAIDDVDDQLSNDDELENGKDDGDDQLSNDDELENRKDDGDDKSSNDDELEKEPHAQPTEETPSNAKTARGAAWLQKSSWLQLIKDVNSSSFNLSQVLPGTASEKQELLLQNCNTLTDSGLGEKCEDLDKNQKPDIQKPQETIDKDVHDTSVNPNVSNSAKKLNHVDQDQEQPDLKLTGVKKDELPAPTPDFLPNARAMGDVMVSETCPFMRNAASMREWTKTKAALSSTHRKKGKVLAQDQ